MRIGIDIRKIRDGGIGSYIKNTLEQLLLLDNKNNYILFVGGKDYNNLHFEYPNVVKVKESTGKYSISEHISLSIKVVKYKLDIYHAPHYVLPAFIPCKTVVTIHDLIHLIYPPSIPFNLGYLAAKALIFLAAYKSVKIITVSKNSKDDIIRYLGIAREKIHVIPNGVSNIFKVFPEYEVAGFLKRNGLIKDYILFVGNGKRHKNLENMLRAMQRVRYNNTRLVVCGQLDERDRCMFSNLIRGLNLEKKITFFGNLDEGSLPYLYNGASMLVFPSYYEGFGLPVIEAFACGTPVITSMTSSLIEVAGDAALLINPSNIDEIANTIEYLLANKEIAEDLRKRGLERAKAFTWKKAAEDTLKIYEEIYRN